MYYMYVKGRKDIFVNNIQYNRVILEVFRWQSDMKTKTVFSAIVSSEPDTGTLKTWDIENMKNN